MEDIERLAEKVDRGNEKLGSIREAKGAMRGEVVRGVANGATAGLATVAVTAGKMTCSPATSSRGTNLIFRSRNADVLCFLVYVNISIILYEQLEFRRFFSVLSSLLCLYFLKQSNGQVRVQLFGNIFFLDNTICENKVYDAGEKRWRRKLYIHAGVETSSANQIRNLM
jgi:hypothetical protein